MGGLSPRPRSILLDAEALSALASADRRMQAWATAARTIDATLYVSALTFAEVADGTARDASVRRAAKAVRVLPVDEHLGYLAGKLRAGSSSRRKPRDLTVDAVVAATALSLPTPTVVLTCDVDDLSSLLADTTVEVSAI